MPGICIDIRDKHGVPGRPYIIDGGGATVDGGGERIPMLIQGCSHFVLRNWNLCNSPGNVLWLRGNQEFAVEEVCAWNAAAVDENSFHPIAIHTSQFGVVRDCGAWGTGRKAISAATNGDDLLWHRVYASYDDPTGGAHPRMAWTIAYNNFRNTLSDCIAACTQLPPDDPRWFYGCFSVDRIDPNDGTEPPADTILHRCLAMSPHSVEAFRRNTVKGVTFENCLDATYEGNVEQDYLAGLIASWRASPILDRLPVDVIAQMEGLKT